MFNVVKIKTKLLFENILQKTKLLALIIFLYGFFSRVLLDIYFWEKNGRHASHLTEIWIYCHKALSPIPPHTTDITIYLLRLIGKITPSGFILHTVSIFAAALSSLTAVIIFYLVKNLIRPNTSNELKEPDYFIPLAAAFFYQGISSAQALSVVSFTHDLIQMPIILGILTLVVAFWKNFNIAPDYRTGLKKNWPYLASAAILSLISFYINPVFLVILPFIFIYSLLQFNYHKHREVKRKTILIVFIFIIIALVLTRYVFYNPILNFVARILNQFHGIDLLYILGQNSKDLIPTDFDKKFLDLYVFCFFLPFGLYAAYKHKRILIPTFFIFGLFLSSIMDRGSRLLNIATAMLASYAFWYRRKFYFFDYFFAGIIILLFWINPGSKMLTNFDKFIFTITPLIILLLYRQYFQKFTTIKNQKIYRFAIITILVLPSFFTLFLYKYWVKPALTQAEYEMASWIKQNTDVNAKLFTNWGEAPYYSYLTNLEPINRLARTEFDSNKIYWSPPAEALSYARENNIKYILINSEDFNLYRPNAQGQTAYSFRGSVPKDLTLERVTGSFIAYLVYRPQEISNLNLIHLEKDKATGKWVKLFQIN